MAIGVDRNDDKKLMERLGKLIEEDRYKYEWKELGKKLLGAYHHLNKMLMETEKSALLYKNINEEVRPQASVGLRRLKKSKNSL